MPSSTVVTCTVNDGTSFENCAEMLIDSLREMQQKHFMQTQEMLSELHQKHAEEMHKRQSEHEERMAALLAQPLRNSAPKNHGPSQPTSQACHKQSKEQKGDDGNTHNSANRKKIADRLSSTTAQKELPNMSDSAISKRSTTTTESARTQVQSEAHVNEVRKKIAKAAHVARAWSWQDVEEETWRIRLQKLLEHPAVDVIVCLVILCNTVFIAAQADYIAKNLAETNEQPWSTVNLLFLLFFTVEIVIRMAAEQKDFLQGRNRLWNIFDFIVVFISIVEQFVSSLSSTRAVRILRILRIIRVARLLRVLRFLAELRAMVMGILHSFTTLIWVLGLLIMNMFLFSVYVTQIIAYERAEMNAEQDVEYSRELNDNFGELALTMYSLYKAVTGGDDWGFYADLLFKANIFTGLLFCFYVAFTTFAVLNVVSGVFIANAFKLIEEDSDLAIMEQTESRRRTITDVKNIFRKADKNRSGAISREEFASHIKDPCVQAYFRQLGLDMPADTNLDGIFDLLDFNNDNEIDIDEFVSGCLHLRGAARSLELERCTFCVKEVRQELCDLKACLFQNMVTQFQQPVPGSNCVLTDAEAEDALRRKTPIFGKPGPPNDSSSIPVLQINDL